MKIIAHRGDCMNAPENTLASVRLALKQRVDYVEFDIQMTKEGVPILFHDLLIEDPRYPSHFCCIQELSLHDLAAIDVGVQFSEAFRATPIPTFEQVLSLETGQTGYFIEIKSRGRVAAGDFHSLATLIRAHSLTRASVIGSLQPAVTAQLKEAELPLRLVGIAATEADIEAFIKQKVDVLAVRQQHLSLSAIARLHQLGLEVWGWVIDDFSHAEELAFWGLDGVITNNSARFMSKRTEQQKAPR